MTMPNVNPSMVPMPPPAPVMRVPESALPEDVEQEEEQESGEDIAAEDEEEEDDDADDITGDADVIGDSDIGGDTDISGEDIDLVGEDVKISGNEGDGGGGRLRRRLRPRRIFSSRPPQSFGGVQF